MRLLIKVGSQITVRADGSVVEERLSALLEVVQILQSYGHEIALVVSGAVAAGKGEQQLSTRQGRAARGQWMVAASIARIAVHYDVPLALLLLSREDIVNRKRYATLRETFDDLLHAGMVPVINENDATTVKDKNDFPDNDHLAAILAVTINADHLFLLTNVVGVCSLNPELCADAELMPVIENVNIQLLKMIGKATSATGRGGMLGKLKAARLATAAGIPTSILDGTTPRHILDIFEGKHVGTLCKPRTHDGIALSNRDRWLLAAQSSDAIIQVDSGAADAIRARKSLLAVGVKKMYGTFHLKETVEILDAQKETIAFGLPAIESTELSAALSAATKPYNLVVMHASDIILI